MASLCSLQGLQPAKRQGQRLCSLQGLSKNKQEVIHDIWSDDDDDNNNSIDDINFYETYLAGDVDIHEEVLPTDSITVRNQLLLENIDININVDNDNNDPVLPRQKDINTIPYYKSKKLNLKKVIKNIEDINIISGIVKKVHIVRMISTHVLKLYIINKKRINRSNFNFNLIINKNFIINLIDVLAKLSEIIAIPSPYLAVRNRQPTARYGEWISTEKFNFYNTVEKNAEKRDILQFILEYVVPGNELLSIFHGIDIRNLQNVISTISEEIVKSYHQNIVSNYKSYVDKYVNNFYLNGLDYEKEEIETSKSLTKEQKTTLKNELYKKFRLLKTDLIEPDRSKHQSVDPFAISFIREKQPIIFPKSR